MLNPVDSASVVAIGWASSGRGSSLALDPDENPIIAYQCFGLRVLRYDDGWTTDVIESDWRGGAHPSLAVDAAGNPRIAYYDERYLDLNYAVWGSAWQTRTVGTGHYP